MASYNSAKITEKLNNAIDEACRRIDEFKRSPQDFTRSRSLTPEKMVRIILGLHGQRLDKEMVLAGTDVSTSAFVQRRDKIKPALFECVLNEFYKGLPMAGGVNGYRVLAIDGTVVTSVGVEDSPNYVPSGKTMMLTSRWNMPCWSTSHLTTTDWDGHYGLSPQDCKAIASTRCLSRSSE